MKSLISIHAEGNSLISSSMKSLYHKPNADSTKNKPYGMYGLRIIRETILTLLTIF